MLCNKTNFWSEQKNKPPCWGRSYQTCLQHAWTSNSGKFIPRLLAPHVATQLSCASHLSKVERKARVERLRGTTEGKISSVMFPQRHQLHTSIWYIPPR